MSQIAILHNLPVTNVINYLIGLGLNVDHYLQCIQKLAQLNFANYIPSQAYKYLKFLIYTEKDKEKQVHYVEQFCAFLAGRFLEEGSEAWKYHNKVVQSIISSCKIDYEKSDSLDKQLIRIISYNYSKEHPEEFRKFVEDFVAGYFDVEVDENGVVIDPLPSDEDDES